MIMITSGLKPADLILITDWSVLVNIFTGGTCRKRHICQHASYP